MCGVMCWCIEQVILFCICLTFNVIFTYQNSILYRALLELLHILNLHLTVKHWEHFRIHVFVSFVKCLDWNQTPLLHPFRSSRAHFLPPLDKLYPMFRQRTVHNQHIRFDEKISELILDLKDTWQQNQTFSLWPGNHYELLNYFRVADSEYAI